MNQWFRFFLIAAATARLSIMLVEEEGPGHIFVHLRHIMGVRLLEGGDTYGLHWWSNLFRCVWCMSVWASALFCLLFWRSHRLATAITTWLAASMAAMVFWDKVE